MPTLLPWLQRWRGAAPEQIVAIALMRAVRAAIDQSTSITPRVGAIAASRLTRVRSPPQCGLYGPWEEL
jgi:hypothetical protein